MGKKVSASTKKQVTTSKNHFSDYLRDQRSPYSIDNMPNEYLTCELFGQFATFLVKKNKNKALSSVLSYISDVKNLLAHQYHRAAAFTNNDME